MTTLSNPFKVLGLTEDATPDDIRRAYRRLALKYHPDRNGDDPVARENFLSIKQAFEQLESKDPDAGYDTERVVAQMQKAAEEAERRRSRRGEGGRGWQLIHIQLTEPRGARIRTVLTSRETLLGVAISAIVAVGMAVSGYVPLWTAPVAGVVLTVLFVWHAFRVVVNETWAVETHWEGLRDLRWDVLLPWADIQDLRPVEGALDLVLAPRAAGRLSATVPAGVFAAPTVYRLPVPEPARLASLIRGQLTA